MPHNKLCKCNEPIEKQIQHFTPIIKKIAKTPNKQNKKILFNSIPKCLTKFISHCSGAILRRDIELPEKQYKQLKKHKKQLIFLADPKKSDKEKTDKFLKKGGFLSLLPILGTILANTVIPFIVDKLRKK